MQFMHRSLISIIPCKTSVPQFIGTLKFYVSTIAYIHEPFYIFLFSTIGFTLTDVENFGIISMLQMGNKRLMLGCLTYYHSIS